MHPENIPTLGLDFNLLDFPEGPVYGSIFSEASDEITASAYFNLKDLPEKLGSKCC